MSKERPPIDPVSIVILIAFLLLVGTYMTLVVLVFADRAGAL
jgi:hypothetical protein